MAAHRIRNWETATARVIKQLKSRYAFVLTGTPLEPEGAYGPGLYSVVELGLWVLYSDPAFFNLAS